MTNKLLWPCCLTVVLLAAPTLHAQPTPRTILIAADADTLLSDFGGMGFAGSLSLRGKIPL